MSGRSARAPTSSPLPLGSDAQTNNPRASRSPAAYCWSAMSGRPCRSFLLLEPPERAFGVVDEDRSPRPLDLSCLRAAQLVLLPKPIPGRCRAPQPGAACCRQNEVVTVSLQPIVAQAKQDQLFRHRRLLCRVRPRMSGGSQRNRLLPANAHFCRPDLRADALCHSPRRCVLATSAGSAAGAPDAKGHRSGR